VIYGTFDSTFILKVLKLKPGVPEGSQASFGSCLGTR
jgi:hypothetical protein